MIISRECVDNNNKVSEKSEQINNFLVDVLNKEFKNENPDFRNNIYNPDFIIAGKYNTICSCIMPIKYLKIGKMINQITPFYTGKDNSRYQVNPNDGIAFGLGIAHMMIALNKINLQSGDLLWEEIFNESKMPNQKERDALQNLLNT